MFFLEVIPLTYLPKENAQILSYFSSENLPKGSLVSVPFRKRKIEAITIDSYQIKEVKGIIKESSFSLKPIEKVLIKKKFFPDYFFELGRWFSSFYLSPLAFSFKIIFPSAIGKFPYYWQKKEKKKEKSLKSEEFLKGDFFEEIKKEISGNQSSQILVLCPENIIANSLFFYLKKTFPKTVLFPSSSKDLSFLWQEIFQGKEKIVVGQRKSLFLPFSNLKKIIVVEAENFSYRQEQSQPFFDSREIAQKIAQLTKAEISFLWLEDNKYFKKEIKKTKIEIVEIKENPEKILSPKIESLLEEKKKFLFYLNRKGYARYLFCRDCFQTINCPNCSVPLVLHKTKENKPYLLCHHCFFRQEVPERCPNCSGYLIEEKGIASQKLFQIIDKNLKGIIFDSEYLKNIKEEKRAVERILKRDFDFVVASELILKWFLFLEKIFDFTLVVSADNLLCFPDFETSEKFFLCLEKLKFLSKKLIIQTFNPSLNIFSEIKKGGKEFFSKEKERREKFSLPLPFSKKTSFSQPQSRLIKIKIKDKSSYLAKKRAFWLCSQMSQAKLKVIGPSPSFIFKEKGLFSYEIFVFLKNEEEKKIVGKIIPSNCFLKIL